MTAPGYRSALVTYLAPQRRKVVLLAVALFGSIGLQLLVPLVLRRFIDAALAGVAVSALLTAGIVYLAASLLDQILAATATYFGADVGWLATNALRHDMARHLLHLDMGFHTGTTYGELIERVDGDVTALSDFLSRFMVRVVGSGLLLLGVLVVLWIDDWRIGLPMTIYVVAVVVILLRLRSLGVAASEEERASSARLYGFIEERLAGLDDIRANGAGPATMLRFVGVMRDFFFRVQRAWRKRITIWVTATAAFWLREVLALVLGVWLTQSGAITIGTAFLILTYVQMIRVPIEQVTQQLQELQKAAGGLVRVEEMMALRTQLDETGTAELPPGALEVDFEGVSFGYERAEAGYALGSSPRTDDAGGAGGRRPPAAAWCSTM